MFHYNQNCNSTEFSILYLKQDKQYHGILSVYNQICQSEFTLLKTSHVNYLKQYFIVTWLNYAVRYMSQILCNELASYFKVYNGKLELKPTSIIKYETYNHAEVAEINAKF